MLKRIIIALVVVLILLGTLFISGCAGGPKVVKNGDAVKVEYTGKLTDGSIFDSSVGSDPLEFTVGQGQVIPGFEKAVIGMKVGDTKTVTIPADEAYGQRNKDLVLEIGRDQLPPGLSPHTGQQFTNAAGRWYIGCGNRDCRY